MVKHTDESIRTLLTSNDKAVRRALVVLFERQTTDEQATDAARHSNNKGFNHADAKQGSRMARVVLSGRPLASWNMARARTILHKYAGQLARIANEKATQSQE